MRLICRLFRLRCRDTYGHANALHRCSLFRCHRGRHVAVWNDGRSASQWGPNPLGRPEPVSRWTHEVKGPDPVQWPDQVEAVAPGPGGKRIERNIRD